MTDFFRHAGYFEDIETQTLVTIDFYYMNHLLTSDIPQKLIKCNGLSYSNNAALGCTDNILKRVEYLVNVHSSLFRCLRNKKVLEQIFALPHCYCISPTANDTRGGLPM